VDPSAANDAAATHWGARQMLGAFVSLSPAAPARSERVRHVQCFSLWDELRRTPNT